MRSRFASLCFCSVAGLFGLWALLLSAGCYIDHSAVKPAELPADWQAGIKDPTDDLGSFAGFYDNVGESVVGGYIRASGGKRARLPDFLWLPPDENVRKPKPGKNVELMVVSPTEMKLIVREEGRVLHEQSLVGEWNAANRSFVYDKTRHTAGGVGLSGHGLPGGVETSWSASRLFKGKDGNLYRQQTDGSAGLGLFVFPVSTSNGSWSRWKPALPTAAAKR